MAMQCRITVSMQLGARVLACEYAATASSNRFGGARGPKMRISVMRALAKVFDANADFMCPAAISLARASASMCLPCHLRMLKLSILLARRLSGTSMLGAQILLRSATGSRRQRRRAGAGGGEAEGEV
uniref:Uncharacterized protein n=1 Tax=Arundo donax TaxID=35708 RepID=A0A0A8YK63_ARUDO